MCKIYTSVATIGSDEKQFNVDDVVVERLKRSVRFLTKEAKVV